MKMLQVTTIDCDDAVILILKEVEGERGNSSMFLGDSRTYRLRQRDIHPSRFVSLIYDEEKS